MATRPAALDLSDNSLDALSKESSISHMRDLVQYVRQLEEQQSLKPSSTSTSEDRLRQQQQEASRRENVLVMRLTTKEQEVQDYLNKLEELRMSSASTSRSVLVDPALNVIFQRMTQELKKAKDDVEQTKAELDAWKFTPDSNTGKRLMARCRLLIQENEELGKICHSGRVAKLEGDLAVTRQHCEDFRNSQAEVDDFLLEMEEDMEGLQSTIILLRNQLKISHEENRRMREMLQLGAGGTLDEQLAQHRDGGSVKMEDDDDEENVEQLEELKEMEQDDGSENEGEQESGDRDESAKIDDEDDGQPADEMKMEKESESNVGDEIGENEKL